MLKYEQEVVTRHLSEINKALELLYDIQARECQAFKDDQHLVGSAKYNLIVVIESAIDMCNHLISKNSYRLPDGYSDTFKVMAENKVLSPELVEDKLIAMARFRNRLVHIYWEIDSDMLYEIIQHNLDDLEKFLAEIKLVLK